MPFVPIGSFLTASVTNMQTTLRNQQKQGTEKIAEPMTAPKPSGPVIQIPPGAQQVLELLNKRGFQGYIVGGCVRDSLRKVEPHDWDICTDATPDEMKKCFVSLKTYDTGLKHGTITVAVDDGTYEVTTFRMDGQYSDGRHPDKVSFVKSLEEDLSRRDFTINAMAYSPETGLSDPFGGWQDLKDLLLRCVGDPRARFLEDSLRILRGLRFMAVLSLRGADEATMTAMFENREALNRVSAERISAELRKFIMGENAAAVLSDRMDKRGALILATVIPELLPCIGFQQNNPYHLYTVWGHTVAALQYSQETNADEITRLAVLFHDIGKPSCRTVDPERGTDHFYGHAAVSADLCEQAMRKLRFDNDTKDAVVELVRNHDMSLNPTKPAVRRWLNRLGELQFRRLLDLRYCDIRAHSPLNRDEMLFKHKAMVKTLEDVLKEESAFKLSDLAINGRDLIELGVPQSKEMGKILKELLDEVIQERTPNFKEALLKRAGEILFDSTAADDSPVATP